MKIRANAWSRLGQNATFGGIGMIEVMKEHEDVQFITADVSTRSIILMLVSQNRIWSQ